jgi:membrane protein DedA with SNARE-associated domain
MNAFGFVISFALFVLGIYLMGIAFDVPENMGLVTFSGGLLVVSAGVFIPVHIMHRIDR